MNFQNPGLYDTNDDWNLRYHLSMWLLVHGISWLVRWNIFHIFVRSNGMSCGTFQYMCPRSNLILHLLQHHAQLQITSYKASVTLSGGIIARVAIVVRFKGNSGLLLHRSCNATSWIFFFIYLMTGDKSSHLC